MPHLNGAGFRRARVFLAKPPRAVGDHAAAAEAATSRLIRTTKQTGAGAWLPFGRQAAAGMLGAVSALVRQHEIRRGNEGSAFPRSSKAPSPHHCAQHALPSRSSHQNSLPFLFIPPAPVPLDRSNSGACRRCWTRCCSPRPTRRSTPLRASSCAPPPCSGCTPRPGRACRPFCRTSWPRLWPTWW